MSPLTTRTHNIFGRSTTTTITTTNVKVGCFTTYVRKACYDDMENTENQVPPMAVPQLLSREHILSPREDKAAIMAISFFSECFDWN